MLLANHGLVTAADSIERAYSLARTCEWCAELEWRCLSAGTPVILSEEDMREAIEQFRNYGQKGKDGKTRGGY